ncbi:MAG TPA: hypothetical protein ENL46_08025 [Candidatus Aminicenantes bacterium]|nr:hypothetical protein [Candidatus Aminicenantes bacterium]
MLRKISGIFLTALGALGLIVEFSNIVSLHRTDYFGVGLALFFICIGGLILTYKPKIHPKRGVAPAEEKTGKVKEPGKVQDITRSLDNISLVGLVLSILQLAVGLIISLMGGILMSALFSNGERGWGILGIWIFAMGLFFLIFGILKTVGYLRLKKRRFSGFILVFTCEALVFLGGLFSFIMGQFFTVAIPFIWSVFVLFYLIRNRSLFRA